MKKLCFASVLLVSLIALALILPFVKSSVNIDEDVVFRTTSNNARFVMGADFTFYEVEINSTHLWMDRSYTTKYYTRYCIYVLSPNNVNFTVNTWFTTENSSAIITIDAPLSTNIDVGFHSPNLVTASALGVVSQTWYSANQTLLMVVNSATNPVFIIRVTVTETLETNITPENIEVTITDMEGCGDWVFSEESYYTFQAKYWDGDGYADLDTMKIRFSDGSHIITAVYDSESWSLETGSDVARIKSGTVTILDSNLLQVTFPIYLENTIFDAFDVDIYMYCIDDYNGIDNWELMALDYFNIYNLGGHSTLTATGNAGRLTGGDVFDLYCNGSSSVEATLTFRNLAHIKLLPLIYATSTSGEWPPENPTGWYLNYQVDYCTEEDDWIEGGGVYLTCTQIAATQDDRYMKFNIAWYDRGGTTIFQEDVYIYYDLYTAGNQTARFWFDTWFNKVNASSTIGGRFNAYMYPMENDANPWLRWLTGNNWGVNSGANKQSEIFTDLKNADDEVFTTQSIKLVRIKFGIVNPNSDIYVQVYRHDVFDLMFSGSPMEGVQTPVWDETRVPMMPQGGLLGTVVSTFRAAIEWLADNIVFGGLNMWQHFLDFMDTIFAWTGNPTAFTDFMLMLNSFWIWMGDSFIYILSFLTSIFTFLGTVMAKFLNTVGTFIANWVSLISGIFSALGDGFNTGVNIWNDLGISTWVILIAIFYPIYLLGLWETKGIDAVINQLRFILDVATWLIRLFISMIQTALNIIGRIIESIPVIE